MQGEMFSSVPPAFNIVLETIRKFEADLSSKLRDEQAGPSPNDENLLP